VKTLKMYQRIFVLTRRKITATAMWIAIMDHRSLALGYRAQEVVQEIVLQVSISIIKELSFSVIANWNK